ncbi:MAG: hypothetical protein IT384_13830 [Deltaproteobacteria bacterium]|nr:hypothetical protein [Deltaproteobacteria bacterium]
MRSLAMAWVLCACPCACACTSTASSIDVPRPAGAVTFILVTESEGTFSFAWVGAYDDERLPMRLALVTGSPVTLLSYDRPADALGLSVGPRQVEDARRSCRLLTPLEAWARPAGGTTWSLGPLRNALADWLIPERARCLECVPFSERRARFDAADVTLEGLRARAAGWLESGAAWVAFDTPGGLWRVDGDQRAKFRGCEELVPYDAHPLGGDRFVVAGAYGRVARLHFDEAAMTCTLEAALSWIERDVPIRYLDGSPDGAEIFTVSASGTLSRLEARGLVSVAQLDAPNSPGDDNFGGVAWLGPGRVAATIASNRVLFWRDDRAPVGSRLPQADDESSALARAGALGLVLGTRWGRILTQSSPGSGPWVPLTESALPAASCSALAPLGDGLIAFLAGARIEHWTPLAGWCSPHEILGSNSEVVTLLVDETRRRVLLPDAVGDGRQNGFVEVVWLEY